MTTLEEAQRACEKNDLETLESLTERYTSKDLTDATGMTLLHIGAIGSNEATIQLLIERYPGDLNATTESGNTPLHVACGESNVKGAAILISFGASTTHLNKEGKRPFEMANIATQIKLQFASERETIEEPHLSSLGLSPGAALPEIKDAYRKLAGIFQPLRAVRTEHAEMFVQISEAYASLLNLREDRGGLGMTHGEINFRWAATLMWVERLCDTELRSPADTLIITKYFSGIGMIESQLLAMSPSEILALPLSQYLSESLSRAVSKSTSGFGKLHRWLVDNELEWAEQTLAMHGVESLSDLSSLSDEDLIRLGFSAIGPRRKISNQISKYLKNPNVHLDPTVVSAANLETVQRKLFRERQSASPSSPSPSPSPSLPLDDTALHLQIENWKIAAELAANNISGVEERGISSGRRRQLEEDLSLIASLKSKITLLESLIPSLEGEILQLKRSGAALGKESDVSREKWEESQTFISRLSDEIVNLRGEIMGERSILEEERDTNAQLQLAIVTGERDKRELFNRISELELKLKEAEDVCAAAERQTDSAGENLKFEISAMRIREEDLQKKMSAAEERHRYEASALEKNIQILSEEKFILETKNKKISLELMALSSAVTADGRSPPQTPAAFTDLHLKESVHRAALHAERKKIADANSTIKILNDKEKKLISDVEALRERLKEEEARLHLSDLSNATLQGEIRKKHSQLVLDRQLARNLTDKLSAAEFNVSELRGKLARAEAAFLALETSLPVSGEIVPEKIIGRDEGLARVWEKIFSNSEMCPSVWDWDEKNWRDAAGLLWKNKIEIPAVVPAVSVENFAHLFSDNFRDAVLEGRTNIIPERRPPVAPATAAPPRPDPSLPPLTINLPPPPLPLSLSPPLAPSLPESETRLQPMTPPSPLSDVDPIKSPSPPPSPLPPSLPPRLSGAAERETERLKLGETEVEETEIQETQKGETITFLNVAAGAPSPPSPPAPPESVSVTRPVGPSSASKPSAASLIATIPPAASEIRLIGKGLVAEDASFIAHSLKNPRFSNVYKIDLAGNNIRAAGAAALSWSINNGASISHINISVNSIGDAGLSSLATCLSKRKLLSLDVSGNAIGPTGVKAFASALKEHPCVTSLDLSVNSLQNEGAIYLGECLSESSCKLTDLNLRHNSIGDIGAAALCSAITQGQSLIKLNLTFNTIGSQGVNAIASMIKSAPQIRRVEVRSNPIPTEARTVLSNLLTTIPRGVALMF